MTNDIKVLINEIKWGDIQRIRQAAICALKNDKAKKDTQYCNRMIEQLETQRSIATLPKDLSEFLIVENTEQTFIPERYYLSANNRVLLKNIVDVDKVSEILTQKRIRYINSTLLFGESGTGKTTFGRCVAHKLGIPFIYISFANLISSLLGKTGSRIKNIFDFIKGQRCVFMIDELDAIGTVRGSANETGEISRIAITLMQALDSLGNGVVLLGATNRIDDIDTAILRRFTRKCEIKAFNPEESMDFTKKYLSSCGYSADDSTIEAISQSNKPSEIERMLNEQIVRWEIEKGVIDMYKSEDHDTKNKKTKSNM